MTPEALEAYEKTPALLEDSLQALKDDHQFLLKGNVFTKNLIQTWIDYKMENEVNELRLPCFPLRCGFQMDSFRLGIRKLMPCNRL